MAKSIAMARCMWRLRTRKRMPGKILRTNKAVFMCREDYDKLRSHPSALAAVEVWPGGLISYAGLDIHISELCSPYWLETTPLRRHAERMLARAGAGRYR